MRTASYQRVRPVSSRRGPVSFRENSQRFESRSHIDRAYDLISKELNKSFTQIGAEYAKDPVNAIAREFFVKGEAIKNEAFPIDSAFESFKTEFGKSSENSDDEDSDNVNDFVKDFIGDDEDSAEGNDDVNDFVQDFGSLLAVKSSHSVGEIKALVEDAYMKQARCEYTKDPVDDFVRETFSSEIIPYQPKHSLQEFQSLILSSLDPTGQINSSQENGSTVGLDPINAYVKEKVLGEQEAANIQTTTKPVEASKIENPAASVTTKPVEANKNEKPAAGQLNEIAVTDAVTEFKKTILSLLMDYKNNIGKLSSRSIKPLINLYNGLGIERFLLKKSWK